VLLSARGPELPKQKPNKRGLISGFFGKLFFNPDSLENIGRIAEKFHVIYF